MLYNINVFFNYKLCTCFIFLLHVCEYTKKESKLNIPFVLRSLRVHLAHLDMNGLHKKLGLHEWLPGIKRFRLLGEVRHQYFIIIWRFPLFN